MTDLKIIHGDDAPSGENLEYDPEFTAMEIAAQPEAERQAGDEITDAQDPDYKDLLTKAKAILARSHDIRAAVFLADCELRLNGLAGFAQATGFIRFCLEEHWNTCHPQLDEDDDDDPTMRINAVGGLAGRTTVVRSLRQWASLTNSRAFGVLTLRDVEVSEGSLPPNEGETPMSKVDVDGAFKDTNVEELSEFLAGARSALEDIEAIDAVFLDKTPGFGPNFESLQKSLSRIVGLLSKAMGEDLKKETSDPAGEEAVAKDDVGAPHSGLSGPGRIESSADVIAALDQIIDYFDRHEPSSPLPVLLKRARRLVGADFLTIVADIAPLGVENVNLLGGIETEY